MTSPLRILLLEDDPTDAELVQELLEADHFVCEVTHVQTRAQFLEALETPDIDLILADYTLPSFDGLSALKLALIARPDLPFIFVSGTLGEEVAVEALKIGATDYVVKTRLSRLVPAVQRALREVGERAERKRAEETLREQADLLGLTHDAIFVRDLNTVIRYWNHAAEELYGWTAEEAVGKLSPELLKTIHPAPLERIRAELLSNGRWEGELARTRKDGTRITVASRFSLQRDQGGTPIAVLETNNDITDRKRAEALLSGEKRILEKLAKGDSLPEILDSLCRLVEDQASGALASILLLDGNRLRHGGAPSLPKAYTDAIDGAAIGPGAGSCGTAAYRREQVIVEDIATDPLWTGYRDLALPHSLRACWSTPVFSSQGSVIATFAIYYREPRSPRGRDQEIIEQITHLAGVAIERKVTYDKLQRSEAHLAEAQRLSHTGSWALNPATKKIHYWSEECYRIWGFDPAQGVPYRTSVFQRIHPDDRDRVLDEAQEALHQKRDYTIELRIVLPDGTLKYVEAIGHHLFSARGELVEVVGTNIDVTERKRAEKALREREAKIRRLVDANIIGIFIWDFEGRIIEANDAFLRMVGYDREDIASGSIRWTDLTPPEWLDRDERRWLPELKVTGSLQPFEKEYYRKDGSRFPVLIGVATFEEGGNRDQGVAFVLDLTERRRAQEEHEKLHRLEADIAHMNRLTMMGELTASLAHEITQPIASARNNARAALNFLDKRPPDLSEVREALACVVGDADRAGHIIDRIRDHIKKAPPRKHRFDLNEAIDEVIGLARSAIAKNGVSVRTHLAEGLFPVQGDRVQLQQVVLNLILNAVEAMSSVEAGERELLVSTGQNQMGNVLVAVRDSGPGIDPENVERVFEAFYTTKSSGVGMGLSICRSIIDAHGGRLWAEATAPRGAVFQFTLPSTESELKNSIQAAHQTRVPREDTVSDAFHQPAYEDNKPPRRSGRERGRHHSGRQ